MPSRQAIVIVAAVVLAPLVLRVLARRAGGRLASRLYGQPVPFSAVVALGASLGGLAGLAESVPLALRHLIEGNLARSFSWDMVWMAPASGVLVFCLLATLLAIAFPVPPSFRTGGTGYGSLGAVALAPCLFVLVCLGAYSALQTPLFGLYGWSAWTLSLGLATLSVRALAGPPKPLANTIGRVSRWALPVYGLLVAGGLWYLPKPRETRALAKLSDADAGRPNVLLLVLDTVRAASLGLYGHSRPTTPNLEKLAARGTVFDWAIATAPWTLPSHASMFTGLYPTELDVDYNVPLAERHQTLAEALREQGYATAGFVANMAFTTRISGLAQGFARYEDWPMTWGRFIESSWLSRAIGRRVLPLAKLPWRGGARRKNAGDNVDDLLAWLDARRQPHRPFFAFINFIDAHDPYYAPRRLRDQFEPAGAPILKKRPQVTEADLASTRAAYEASIAMLDEELGRLVGELERRSLFKHTLIIVVGDHGEHFGEHGLQFHGNSLYLPLIHVPLVVVYAATVPAGVRIHRPVSLRDIPATVLHVVTGSLDRTFPGHSLVDLSLWGDSVPLEPLLSVRQKPYLAEPWEPSFQGSIRSVLQFPYHLIRHDDGQQELYRVDRDPAEARDLIPTTDSLVLRRLEHSLDSLSRDAR